MIDIAIGIHVEADFCFDYIEAAWHGIVFRDLIRDLFQVCLVVCLCTLAAVAASAAGFFAAFGVGGKCGAHRQRAEQTRRYGQKIFLHCNCPFCPVLTSSVGVTATMTRRF